MNYFPQLMKVATGSYKVPTKNKWWQIWKSERGGWLRIDRDNTGTSITWTTDKDTH
jgi:hypothetical protein